MNHDGNPISRPELFKQTSAHIWAKMLSEYGHYTIANWGYTPSVFDSDLAQGKPTDGPL